MRKRIENALLHNADIETKFVSGLEVIPITKEFFVVSQVGVDVRESITVGAYKRVASFLVPMKVLGQKHDTLSLT